MPYDTYYCTKCITAGVDKWDEEQVIITDYCFICQENTLHSKNTPIKILSTSKQSLDSVQR